MLLFGQNGIDRFAGGVEDLLAEEVLLTSLALFNAARRPTISYLTVLSEIALPADSLLGMDGDGLHLEMAAAEKRTGTDEGASR